MTLDQKQMWALLSNDAEMLSHMWAKEITNLKGEKFHDLSNYYLGYIIDNFNSAEGARILSTWLKTYNLPLDPSKMSNFDKFYDKFGSYINKNAKFIQAY